MFLKTLLALPLLLIASSLSYGHEGHGVVAGPLHQWEHMLWVMPLLTITALVVLSIKQMR